VLFQTMVVLYSQNEPLPYALGMSGVMKNHHRRASHLPNRAWVVMGYRSIAATNHVAGEECLITVLPVLRFPGGALAA
jgi:hypothetical protein